MLTLAHVTTVLVCWSGVITSKVGQPSVSRATTEVALTKRHPVLAPGVITSNVGQPSVSRATTEVALTKRHPVFAPGM